MKTEKYPKCDKHKDCFANKHGRCICLKDNDFGDKPCPFYKDRHTVDMQELNGLEE